MYTILYIAEFLTRTNNKEINGSFTYDEEMLRYSRSDNNDIT